MKRTSNWASIQIDIQRSMDCIAKEHSLTTDEILLAMIEHMEKRLREKIIGPNPCAAIHVDTLPRTR